MPDTKLSKKDYAKIRIAFLKQPNEVLLLRDLRATELDEDSVWYYFRVITESQLRKRRAKK